MFPSACGKHFIMRLKGAGIRAGHWHLASLCQAILEKAPLPVPLPLSGLGPSLLPLGEGNEDPSPSQGRLSFWVACCQGCPGHGSPVGGLGSLLQPFFVPPMEAPQFKLDRGPPVPLHHHHPGQPNRLNRNPQTFPFQRAPKCQSPLREGP